MIKRIFVLGMVVAGLALIVSGLGYDLSLGSLGLGRPEAPTDQSMSITIPKMDRVQDTPVYTAAGEDEGSLSQGTVHLAGTGFPWETGANVYIVGHRLGYPNTDSFLVFYDLDKLENGDEVMVTDSDGNEYRYTVFNKMVVSPYELWVTDPVPGQNVVSLQTCTLPDYSQRLIVQAELQSW